MTLDPADIRALVLGQPWRRSWQRASEVHLLGCPRNHYYIASCSESCSRARLLARRAGVGLPDPASLPVDYPDRGGALENYG